MQACTKRAMQSSELLRSDVESSFSCVGRAFAMPSSTAAGPSGSGAMTARGTSSVAVVVSDGYGVLWSRWEDFEHFSRIWWFCLLVV